MFQLIVRIVVFLGKYTGTAAACMVSSAVPAVYTKSACSKIQCLTSCFLPSSAFGPRILVFHDCVSNRCMERADQNARN